jgi:ppGpp synthetase/RelA/SpoT-type nucleotidyltranferase
VGRLSNPCQQFLDDYKYQRPFYAALSAHVAATLEARLAAAGVRVLVTNRAKSFDAVQGKLDKLVRDGASFSNTAELKVALYDLAGVRVALYFPGDMSAVSSLIRKTFKVRPAKSFPRKGTNKYNRFPGYCATHFIGMLKQDDAKRIGTEYSEELFEIQVASVFMHAWAEVEHDLRYKPLSGTLSEDELSILESLNGIALAAETQLRQLERAVDRRTRRLKDIGNHYELAGLLSSLAAQKPLTARLSMGRADVLFLFLEALNMVDSVAIKALFERVNYDNEERSVVDRLMDVLLREDPERASLFASARQRAGAYNPYEARRVGDEDTAGEIRFLRLWQLAETALAQLVSSATGSSVRGSLWRVVTSKRLSDRPEYGALTDLLGRLNQARHLRNRFVHEGYALQQSELDRETRYLHEVIVTAAQLLDESRQEEIMLELGFLDSTVPGSIARAARTRRSRSAASE